MSNGAELVFGGRIENDVLLPTILHNVSHSERVSCEEIFAPVVIVNSVATIDEGHQCY